MRFLIVFALALGACVAADPLSGQFSCVADQCPPDQTCVCGICTSDPSQAHCGMPDGATLRDSPLASVDAPPSAPDSPIGVLFDAPRVFDSPLSTFDARIVDAPPAGSPDAKISTPDAPLSTPDAFVPQPDAQLFDAGRMPLPDAPAPFCNDGICQNGLGENCLTCPQDCGDCLCNADTCAVLDVPPSGANCQNCPQCPSLMHCTTCDGVCQKIVLGTNDCKTCPSDCTDGECN